MGVPAFFRWLSLRYPKVVRQCVEQVSWTLDGEEIPTDACEPNPNGMEFDNLYLDMNGIIHPCTHPEDKPAPTTETEMFQEIFRYIDRLMCLVRPRKLVYFAVDGVAPRAKINQQRSRRFRAAQEAEEKAREEEKLRREWIALGRQVPARRSSSKPFDSNVITPGTPFMSNLSDALRRYVADRIRTQPAWRHLKILFSDSSVPGEGEHKVAEFIRQQRAQMDYDPSIRHVLYGLDADLIMLALATHELHFTILREQVSFKNRERVESERKSFGDEAATGNIISGVLSNLGGKKPFEFLHISTLREYLRAEFFAPMSSAVTVEDGFGFDLERVIDDFVFLCFFVGNDFLPHLPVLDIREGALDYLLALYKTMIPGIGYITNGMGDVDCDKARVLLRQVGIMEDDVFQKRMEVERQQRVREEAEAEREKNRQDQRAQRSEAEAQGGLKIGEEYGFQQLNPRKRKADSYANKLAAEALRDKLAGMTKKGICSKGEEMPPASGPKPSETMEKIDALPDSLGEASNDEEVNGDPTEVDDGENPLIKASHAPNAEDVLQFDNELRRRMKERQTVDAEEDKIRLGQEGWKDRYYDIKFQWRVDDRETRQRKEHLFQSYWEGLLWVMRYYYNGCASWDWYFPFHYAPFASDLCDFSFSSASVKFIVGAPFKPFEQLMSVLPAISAKGVLPDPYVSLMTDKSSPIHAFYPETFELDLNGKRFAWQGVALLPFVDATLLKKTLQEAASQLTPNEQARNRFGQCYLYSHADTPLGLQIGSLSEVLCVAKINRESADGTLFGGISFAPADVSTGTSDVVVAVLASPAKKRHVPRPCEGAIEEAPKLTSHDVYETENGLLGWKTAKFGVLGRAAAKLGRLPGPGGPHPGGHGGTHGMGRGRGGFDLSRGVQVAMFHGSAQPPVGYYGSSPGWPTHEYSNHQSYFNNAATHVQGYAHVNPPSYAGYDYGDKYHRQPHHSVALEQQPRRSTFVPTGVQPTITRDGRLYHAPNSATRRSPAPPANAYSTSSNIYEPLAGSPQQISANSTSGSGLRGAIAARYRDRAAQSRPHPG